MTLKVKDMTNVAGFAVTACSLVGGAASVAALPLALLAGGALITDLVKDKKRGDVQASIDKVQKKFRNQVAQIALVQGISQDELDKVTNALNEAIYHTGATHADFARWQYDPKTVADRMLERLAQHNALFETSKFARDLARGTLFRAFSTVRETEGYLKQSEIYFRAELLTKVDAIDVRTQAILEKLERLENGGQVAAIEHDTETSIKQTIRSLITAQEGARKRAGDKLEADPPDPQGAKAELRQLAAQQEENVRDAAQTYMDIGNIAYMNDTHEALDAYTRVTELTPDDPEGWNRVGHLQHRLGDLDAAKSAYTRVETIAEKSNDKMAQAVAYGNLGVVEKTRGNLDGAVTYHQKALVLHKELGRKEGMAIDYGNLGIVEETRGNLDGAVDYYKKSLAIEKELGRKAGMASDYGNLGVVEEGRGNLDGACGYWRQAYDLFVQVGARPQIEQVGGWMREAGCADAPDDGGG